MKLRLLLLFVILFSLNNSNAQDIQLVNKIVGNTDPVNYYIGHFPVAGSDGLDLHWHGGIRFGDSYSSSVMQITNGKVGIGTTNPQAKLDIDFGGEPKSIKFLEYANAASSMNSLMRFTWYNDTADFGMVRSGGMPIEGLAIRFNSVEKIRFMSNGNVGIGTTNPIGKLDVNGAIFLKGKSILDSDGSNSYFKSNGISYFENNGRVSAIITSDGSIGIGTTAVDHKLTVNGTIHSSEVIVDTNFTPDYVFQKYYTGKSELKSDYVMPTLTEIESFTKEKNHLPNVPSAKEMQQKGVSLGEMSNILLQKVEELTLYIISQNKDIEELKAQVNTLKSQKQ